MVGMPAVPAQSPSLIKQMTGQSGDAQASQNGDSTEEGSGKAEQDSGNGEQGGDASTTEEQGGETTEDKEVWFEGVFDEITMEDVYDIGLLAFLVLVSLLVGKIAKATLHYIGQKRRDAGQHTSGIALDAVSRAITSICVVVGIRLAVLFMEMTEVARGIALTTTSVLLVIAVGLLFFFLIDIPVYWLKRKAEKTETKLDDMLVPLVRTTLRVTVAVLVFLQIIDVLSDKPITSIIAGLGIGSLAIAFAAQNSISNIFGSLMIFADRPFELGERIMVDGHDGTVEHVGLRSTRVRRLDGHLVTIPNGRLADMSIHNVAKRPHIRKIMNITITYDTPPDKVERAVEVLREIFDNHEGMNEEFPPRVYFDNFNDASLNIIVIFWYHPPSYWDYMAFCQKVNLEIFRRFNEEGIDFAFPTQTLYLAGDENRPLNVGIVQRPSNGGGDGGSGLSARAAEEGGGVPDYKGKDPPTAGEEADAR